jgi:hypothetical protein
LGDLFDENRHRGIFTDREDDDAVDALERDLESLILEDAEFLRRLAGRACEQGDVVLAVDVTHDADGDAVALQRVVDGLGRGRADREEQEECCQHSFHVRRLLGGSVGTCSGVSRPRSVALLAPLAPSAQIRREHRRLRRIGGCSIHENDRR